MSELALILGFFCLVLIVLLSNGLWRLQRRFAEHEAERDRLARRVGELETALAGERPREESRPATTVAPLPGAAVTAPAGEGIPPGFASPTGVGAGSVSLPPSTPAAVPPRMTPPPLPVAPMPESRPAPAWAERPGQEAGAQVRKPKAWGSVDWERFMGVRLFAWLGGLALFLGVAYFVKYSFDRDLVPPSARVLIGLVVGAGLIGTGLRLGQRAYAVTAQTLIATGVVILYAALYAGHGLYRLAWLPQVVVFAGMTVITALAFALAVRLGAQVVAVLGLLGGFLTPVLLSTGQNQPGTLFTYIGFLDVGLLAVVLARRWGLLAVLGAVGTLILAWAWALRFFTPEAMGTAWWIFASFNALFVAGLAWGRDRGTTGDWLAGAASVVAFGTLLFAAWLLAGGDTGRRVGPLFAFVGVADLALLTAAWCRDRFAPMHGVAAVASFGFLAVWQAFHLTEDLFGWALGLTLGFAVLHTALPLIQRRWRPDARMGSWAGLIPPLALVVWVVPLVRLPQVSFALWPAVLLVNLLALWAAMLRGRGLGIAAALVMTVLLSALWIMRLNDAPDRGLGGTLAVVLVTGVLFAAGSMILRARRPPGDEAQGAASIEDTLTARLPEVSVILPFLLLAQLVGALPVPEPSAVFAVALVLVGLVLALTWWLKVEALPLACLGALALLEHVWLGNELHAATWPLGVVLWGCLFLACFAAFPWVFRRRVGEMRLPWVAAALAGVPQFHVVYRVVERYWPNDAMGLIPLAFGVVPGLLLVAVIREGRRQGGSLSESPAKGAGVSVEGAARRRERLAWLGGVTLFFVTVALPIQFERHWLTLGLALEGAALLWLFGRVGHPGLRGVGVALLGVVFVRLTLNPAVLDEATRGAWPLANRWLYLYGLAAAAHFAGAWLLKGPPPDRDRIGRIPGRVLLTTLGTILVFGLVNVQIADFFTAEGERVRFEFSGNFGRDMTYTIAWALFALGLVGVGIARGLAGARWSGLGLLAVAVLKLFLHDLARLDNLYRVGALMGVALVAIAASVLYQRYVARPVSPADTGTPRTPPS